MRCFTRCLSEKQEPSPSCGGSCYSETMRVKRDRHHILHHRVEWSSRPQSMMLRESPALIPVIDRDVHNEIHRIAPAVPLLGYHALCRVASSFNPQSGTMESLDNLMLAIEEFTRHPKAHSVERGVGRLAIEALDIQRAILRGNVK